MYERPRDRHFDHLAHECIVRGMEVAEGVFTFGVVVLAAASVGAGYESIAGSFDPEVSNATTMRDGLVSIGVLMLAATSYGGKHVTNNMARTLREIGEK